MSPRELVRLGDVATIVRKTIAPERISDGTTYVGLENIERGGALLNITSVSRGDLASTKFEFTADQVLFGKLRPYLAKIARPAFSGVCSTDILPITPGPRLDKNYLAQFLVSPDEVALAASRATGANLPRLSPGELAKFEIPLPPLDEQRRIAAILDHADALRTKRREALAHLDDLTQSIFLEMFVRGGSDDWPLVTIEQIAAAAKGSIRTGPFGSQLLHGEFVDDGVAVLGIDNAVSNEFKWRERRFITERKYAKLSRYTVRPGDVLITIMGTCGRCAVVPDDIPLAINTKHLCCITVNRDVCLPEFLHASFLRHPTARAYLQRTAKGAIMSGLNMAIIKGMPLALPPLELQARFAQRLEAVQASRCLHHASHEELDSLFASLQSRAFAGAL